MIKNLPLVAFVIAIMALGIAADNSSYDPWTYLSLNSNFSTTSNNSLNVGLNFTPQPNILDYIKKEIKR